MTIPSILSLSIFAILNQSYGQYWIIVLQWQMDFRGKTHKPVAFKHPQNCLVFPKALEDETSTCWVLQWEKMNFILNGLLTACLTCGLIQPWTELNLSFLCWVLTKVNTWIIQGHLKLNTTASVLVISSKRALLGFSYFQGTGSISQLHKPGN